MPPYAVRYTYDERTDVRDRVRPEHRAYLASLVEHGALLGCGPFTDGEPGALLVFSADSPDLTLTGGQAAWSRTPGQRCAGG